MTQDRRWRVDLLDDGRWELRLHGHLILHRASMEQVGRRLAEAGVDPDELVEL